MADCCDSTEFEWIETNNDTRVKTRSFQFLKEGYLHTSVKEEVSLYGTIPRRRLMGKRASEPSMLGSWSRRWAVLSEMLGGHQLLLYKDRGSFHNCEVPCLVVSLKDCQRLATYPMHPKSENTFMVVFDKKTFYFYTDKCSDLEGWMKTLQKILNMQDASCYSPLKGLPRQKAMRKGQRSPTTPEPHTSQTSPPLPLSSADSVEDSHGASSSLEKGTRLLQAWSSHCHSQPLTTSPDTQFHSLKKPPAGKSDKTLPKNNSVKFLGIRTLST